METQSFLRALHDKYCDTGPEDVKVHMISNKEVKMIGFDKIDQQLSDLLHLRIVLLNSHNIDRFCDSDDSPDLQFCLEGARDRFHLKSLQELDISNNQISAWQTVSDIVSLSPKLQEIVLTGNPLSVPAEDSKESLRESFKNIKNLIFGNVGRSWSELSEILEIFTGIVKIKLFGNLINDIDLKGSYLDNVTSIDLCNNPIKKWEQILKLGGLQKLEYLDLSRCQLESIDFSINPVNKTTLFPSLRYLNLRTNDISDWKSIAQLASLPFLNSLLLKNNPIFDTHSSKYYIVFNTVVSMIDSLTILDSENVTEKMRDDAEKYYFRNIYPKFVEASASGEEAKDGFYRENPTFQKLLDRFGEPAIAKKLTKEEEIKAKYVMLNVVFGGQTITKQVPLTMKIASLKMILRRVLKIDRKMNFQLRIEGPDDWAEVMDERHDVGRYRIDDDHRLTIV